MLFYSCGMEKPRLLYGEFLTRRLHSLSGILPLSGFLFFHLYANAFSTKGEAPYNATVDQLRSLPFLTAIEWGTIFAPFLFHMVLGVWILFSSKPNCFRFIHPRNTAYVLQRVTAVIAFVFILYHVIGLRFLEPAMDHETGALDYYGYLREQFRNPWVYWWYVAGIAACCFHLANGICTFCMTWGLTIGRYSQRIMATAMLAAGLLLFLVGIAALNGFNRAGDIPLQTAAIAAPAPADE